jgi:ribosomal protein S18 acetylase RimI-like enzyme
MNLVLRKYRESDIEKLTKIWNEIIEDGVSFAWEEPLTVDEARKILQEQTEVVCACSGKEIAGFYFMRPNGIGRCSHIANATYAVQKEYRGSGIGKRLVLHSIQSAKEHGFLGLQYNTVVATNFSAIELYKKLGFTLIGTIKNGFRIVDNTYVDLLIFYKAI